jgi:hypothetical protein
MELGRLASVISVATRPWLKLTTTTKRIASGASFAEPVTWVWDVSKKASKFFKERLLTLKTLPWMDRIKSILGFAQKAGINPEEFHLKIPRDRSDESFAIGDTQERMPVKLKKDGDVVNVTR